MTDVTVFGKYLRKMRIDCSEILGKMAGRLGISAAYLSAIENGCREIPEGFIEKIWGYDTEAEYNTIEVYVSFLMKKYPAGNGGIFFCKIIF